MWDFTSTKACHYSFWVATLPTKEANFPSREEGGGSEVLITEIGCDTNSNLMDPEMQGLGGESMPTSSGLYLITARNTSLSIKTKSYYSRCFPLCFREQN